MCVCVYVRSMRKLILFLDLEERRQKRFLSSCDSSKSADASVWQGHECEYRLNLISTSFCFSSLLPDPRVAVPPQEEEGHV